MLNQIGNLIMPVRCNDGTAMVLQSQAYPGASSNTQRARLPRECKQTPRPSLIVDMCRCLLLGLTCNNPELSRDNYRNAYLSLDLCATEENEYDDDCINAHRTFQTAMERIKILFPTPQKEWVEPKNAYECLQQEDWRGWILAAQTEHKSWIDQHVFKVIRKNERECWRNTYPLKQNGVSPISTVRSRCSNGWRRRRTKV